jgi:hypothetical protein
MRLWKRRRPTLDDLVFGRLTRDRDCWLAEPPVVGADRPLVSVVAGEEGPSDAQRSAYQQFQKQLVGLREEISEALYQLYTPYLGVADWQGPRPDSASHLRAMLEFSSVRFLEEGAPELLFAFKGDIWPDAMFIVEIRDGGVRGISLDD